MQETIDRAAVPRGMTVSRWLFNPFIRLGGARALAIGLGAVVLTGLAAAGGGVHLDGLLDFHPGYRVPFWVPIVEGLVNWLVFTALLAPVLFVAPRNVRLIDVAGTQALARWPLLPAALASLPPTVRQGNEALVAAASEGRLVTPEGATLAAGALAGACGIWMVWLMWKAFAIACNQRGPRAGAWFAAALVGGEMVTKLVFRQTAAVFAMLAMVLVGATGAAAQTNEAGLRGEVRMCRDDAPHADRTVRACGQVRTGKWIKKWGTLLGAAATLGLSAVAARTGSGKAVHGVSILGTSTLTLAVVGSSLEAAGYRTILDQQDEQLRRAREAGAVGVAHRVAW